MKKLVAILLIAAFAIPAFANDATVLPAGVIRARVIPTYAFGDKSFNANGDKVDIPFPPTTIGVKAFNLGLAVEYGINDWMTFGAQWAPGTTLWSNVEPVLDLPSTLNVNGLADIKLGLAMQIVGAKAPIISEDFRFAITPAVIIPMPGVDLTDASKVMTVADVTIQDGDKHAWALGGRVSGDYILNDMFYLNLCGEFTKYLTRKDASYQLGASKADIEYGYKLQGEFEPHFAYDLGNSSNISVGIPVTYTMWPKAKVAGSEVTNSDGYSLSVTPAVSYFFLAGPLPMELTAQYGLPFMGKNTSAMNSITFQIKTFIKF